MDAVERDRHAELACCVAVRRDAPVCFREQHRAIATGEEYERRTDRVSLDRRFSDRHIE